MKKFLITLSAFALLGSLLCHAQNITGTISCDGKGIANVVVSDGFEVTTTDANGHYQLTSEKKNGYVFYSIPSGYMPKVNPELKRETLIPPFYSLLYNTKPDVAEVHNFKLVKEVNDKHIMIVGADAHIASRYNDINQFADGFIAKIKEEKQKAGTTPLYSTIVGDISWDNYWYMCKCLPTDVMNVFTSHDYPTRLFPVMGNHDNDGATPQSDDNDFNSTAFWRHNIAPNYYSYNIGKIHYVVLDDIRYKHENTDALYNDGLTGSRNYECTVVDDVMNWLRKDLAHVGHDTPIIIELHAPMFKLDATAPFAPHASLANGSTEAICEMVKDYKQVHIWSGHLHYNYHAYPAEYPNVHENNIAAICAIWWRSGYMFNRHVCHDGTPGGYEVYYMDGDKISWQFHSMEENGNAQFRVYDSNSLIDFYSNNATARKMVAEIPSKTDWSMSERNVLYINVFNYDPAWKVEAFENGKPLKVTRILEEDPMHNATFNIPFLEEHPTKISGVTKNKTAHLFKVKPKKATSAIDFKVTDRFGNVYTKHTERPLPFIPSAIDK